MLTTTPQRRSADRGPEPMLAALDQGLVSISALFVAIAVARLVPAAEFGAFVLVVLMRRLLIDLARALAGRPAQLLHDQNSDGANDEAATSFSLFLGLIIAIPGIVIGQRMGIAADYAIVLAVSAGVIMLHDTLRHLLFAQQDVRGAVLLDGGVLASQIAIGIIILSNGALAWAHMAAWSIGAAVSCVFGMWRLDARISLRTAREWPRRTRAIWPRLLLDTALVQTQRQASSWLMLGYGSFASVAGFGGSQTAFRPLGIVSTTIESASIPTIASLNTDTETRKLASKKAWRVSLGLAAAAFAVTLVLFVLPAGAGSAVLGDTWQSVDRFIVPVGAAQITQALAIGAQMLLLAQGRTRELTRTRLGCLTLSIGAMAIGGVSGGAHGAAYGMAIASAIALPIWWMAVKTQPDEIERRSEV